MRKWFLCNYGMGHSQDEDSDIRGESGGEGVRVYIRGFFLRMGEGEEVRGLRARERREGDLDGISWCDDT